MPLVTGDACPECGRTLSEVRELVLHLEEHFLAALDRQDAEDEILVRQLVAA